ncbi:MAG: diaminopimelate epimerase [Bacteroidota bacterium]
MKVDFHKYQGTGNDFILIDDRELTFPSAPGLIQRLCDRNFGIGSDGLILIQKHPTLDYRMIYFNADGSQSLCGNGSRCGFSFAQDLEIISQKARFETTDGIHEIKQENGLIHFKLFDIPEPDQLSDTEWYVDTGSPHYMVISEDVKKEDVIRKGKNIRYSSTYASQNGTNVNFVQLSHDSIKVRTYERGVENETLSCGTGATAVGILAGKLGYKSPVKMETEGGVLEVFFLKHGNMFKDVWLAGPAAKVFEGTIQI